MDPYGVFDALPEPRSSEPLFRRIDMLKIGILLGDDIGLEVVPEAVKVMKAAARKAGARGRVERAPDRAPGPRAARAHHAPADGRGAGEDRWLPVRPDRPRLVSAQRSDLDHAAAAQAPRPLRQHQAGQVLSEHPVGAQERGHRVPARGDRRHAVLGYRRRGRRRVPPERRDHDRRRASSPARARAASRARRSRSRARARARP